MSVALQSMLTPVIGQSIPSPFCEYREHLMSGHAVLTSVARVSWCCCQIEEVVHTSCSCDPGAYAVSALKLASVFGIPCEVGRATAALHVLKPTQCYRR